MRVGKVIVYLRYALWITINAAVLLQAMNVLVSSWTRMTTPLCRLLVVGLALSGIWFIASLNAYVLGDQLRQYLPQPEGAINPSNWWRRQFFYAWGAGVACILLMVLLWNRL